MSRPESRVLNLSVGTVSGMEEAREPAEAFAFEFDQAGAVAAVKLADDWAEFVEVEEFGFALLYAYAEQHAQAAAVDVAAFAPQKQGVRYPTELRDDVLQLSRDVSSLFQALGSWNPTPQEPVEVGDRYRHITIETVGGMPNEIKVNESWLRTADFADVENDIVAAFRAMSHEAPKDEVLGQLADLRSRLADVVARRNDHNKG